MLTPGPQLLGFILRSPVPRIRAGKMGVGDRGRKGARKGLRDGPQVPSRRPGLQPLSPAKGQGESAAGSTGVGRAGAPRVFPAKAPAPGQGPSPEDTLTKPGATGTML